jgi:hypothetical protein
MAGRTGVFRRVAIGRIVATVCAAALLACAEVHSGGPDLHALLTFPSFGMFDGRNRIDVNTSLLGHDILYGRST